MKRSLIFHLVAFLVLSAALFVSGLFVAQFVDFDKAPAETTTVETFIDENGEEVPVVTEPEKPEKPDSISVAVYPYVANMELFKKVLEEQWYAMEPEVKLEFVTWDCYEDPYPNNIDVITYDALFTAHLANTGFIQPLDTDTIDNTYGILPFAMDGAHYNGDLYGLPFLVCSSFLIHRTDDEELNKVENFEDLYKVMKARKSKDPTTALQIDSWGEGPYFYLDALIDYTGEYTTYEEGTDMNSPDSKVIKRLKEIQAMTVPIPEGENFRVRFAEGEGTACYAYSESLYLMEDLIDELTIRPISFFKTENIQMYYADIASLCSQVTDPVEKEYCMKLINLMASEEFLTELCYGNGDVQYMFPAREQVYDKAAELYPMYAVLRDLALDENNRIFRFGPHIFEYKKLATYVLPYDTP